MENNIRYGIYVSNERRTPWAGWIVSGLKEIETRNKNMLGKLVGERVAVIATGNHPPLIVGYVTITSALHVGKDLFDRRFRKYTMIEKGDRYDCTEKGKWLYYLSDAEACNPMALPENIIRHGRSYVEFN